MEGFNNADVTKLARSVAEMCYLKESLSGIDAKSQAQMYYHLVNSDQAIYTVINAFKSEIEIMNQAKSLEEMQDMRETALFEAQKLNVDIERYFEQIRESYT